MIYHIDHNSIWLETKGDKQIHWLTILQTNMAIGLAVIVSTDFKCKRDCKTPVLIV